MKIILRYIIPGFLLFSAPISARAETILLDGMEWERVNPLIASADVNAGSSYTLSPSSASPFVTTTFGTSHVSGWLNDLGLGRGPGLGRGWRATSLETTNLAFDVRPDGGNYAKWGFYLQNSSNKAVSLFFGSGRFQVRGKMAMGKPSVYISIPNVTVTSGQWYHVAISVNPPAGGDRSYSITVKDQNGTTGTLDRVYYDVDSTDAINQFSVWPSGISAASLHIDNVVITKASSPEFRYAYLPTHNLIRFFATPSWNLTDWLVTLRKKGDTTSVPLAQQAGTFPFPNGASQMSIPTLAPGDYDLTLRLSNPVTGAVTTVVRTFTQKTPPWQNNDLGTARLIVPPFTPLVVNSSQGTVDCLLRSHRPGNSGLWDQVTSQGSPLLASPMQLKANVGGLAYTATGSGVAYSKVASDEVIGSTRWTAGSLSGSTTVDYEYDGMMKVTLDIDATTTVVDELYLVIPLQDSAMINDGRGLLLHAVTDGLRKNPAGRLPTGTGVVWKSSAIGRNESVGPFVPYIWLGGPERGICWFADSDKDWIVDDEKPEIEVSRTGGQTSLIVHFVNKSAVINRKRTIVFGLMATPAKPMPERPNFRKWWLGVSTAEGDFPFDLNPSAMGHGGIAVSSSLYPAFKNFSLYDEMAATRQTGLPPTTQFMDFWMAQPQFGAREFTAAWKDSYRKVLKNAFDCFSNRWHGNYVASDLVSDGMEGPRINPMSPWTPPNSSYTFTTSDPSPFVSNDFVQSTRSGLLVNESTTSRPSLIRDHFGASPRNWMDIQFDVKPVSGRWDQWGIWIGRTEENTYAAMLKISNNAFWLYGRSKPNGPLVWKAVPNVTVQPGTWYHVDFLISPTANSSGEKTVDLGITDSANHGGTIRNSYFLTDFSSGVNRILFTGVDHDYQPGAIQVDNILASNVKPTRAFTYVNPTGMTWDSEARSYLDEWSIFDVADPRWDSAVAQGYRWLREKSSTYNSLTHLDYRASPSKSYIDMVVYYCSKMLSSFSDGIYFDNLAMAPNYSPVVGPGYTDDRGRVHPGMGIFAMRNLYKRIATMQYQMGMKPLIWSHMTNAQLVPVLSFAAIHSDLEWYGPGLDPAVAVNMDFQDRFGLDTDTAPLLAGSTGLQSGNPTFLIDYLYSPTAASGVTHEHLLRTVLASCLVHEIRLPAADMRSVMRLLQGFGYGEADSKTYHYWDADQAITTSGAAVKPLLLSRPNKALVVLGSFGPGGTASIALDLAKLKLPSTVQAIDYETGIPLFRSAPGVFAVPIPKHDFKMVLIQ